MLITQEFSSITVAALYRYPIKSCRGEMLPYGEINEHGFKHDHAFMLVHPTTDVLQQKNYPRMVLINVFVENTSLQVQAPSMPPLQIGCKQNGPLVEVPMRGNLCKAIDQGDHAAEWFSTFLDTSCRLVRMANMWQDATTEQRSFVDHFPFLLTSESSLADLNSHLAKPVSMPRFRPNIVLRGCAPFAEDGWKRIRIGECLFETAEACQRRCTVINIDPNTALVGEEPLRTLATYRRNTSGHVLFGQYLIHHQIDTICLGDPVEILA